MKNILLSVVVLVSLTACANGEWARAIQAMNAEYQRQELHRSKLESSRVVKPTPAPTQTKCYKIGNQINCTTM